MQLKRDLRVPKSRRGFVLVVILSVMFLLAILALGMLSLSSVALRTSSQGEANAIARANARIALMMAIGELQKQLGPDSRISAAHDAGTTPSGGQPHWTAVYDAWALPTDPTTAETPGSRSPNFRRWLASGANQAKGGPVGSGEFIQLVGSGSVGTSAVPGDYITVPLHELTAANNQGQIGWWVADESTKAKINAGPDNTLASNPLSNAQSPPYVYHKAINELSAFNWKPGQRAIAISNGSLNLAAEIGPRGIGSLNHNVTLHSAGVLADVRAGRLKRDLTNLLSRPIAELENKPFYLADGRMNRFQITDAGAITNAANMPIPSGAGANRWGINLEELHLFHQLHREIDWSTGQPRLVNKNTKETIAADRFYIYRQPLIEALHLILSFRAVPDAATPGTYRMQAMLDGMMAVSNPNDIPIEWQPSTVLSHTMHSLPYRVRWNIRRANLTVKHSHLTNDMNLPFFKCNIRGGFTLEPGEAAVFGNSIADTQSRQCNLTRGFIPRGGVLINDDEWGRGTSNEGLRAGSLALDDRVNFTMIKSTGTNNAASGWVLCGKSFWNSTGSSTEFGVGIWGITGGGSTLYTPLMNQYLLSNIVPPQVLPVQDFVNAPMPVMMITLMPNVEKSRTIPLPPNAFPSRPFHFTEPAIAERRIQPLTQEQAMQTSQMLTISEPMDYEFANDRTLAAGAGGRNLYHGGAREVGLGGSFNVVKRRIPLTPPLSIGAFENAIACGLLQRFRERIVASTGDALVGHNATSPAIAKAIGNSWSNPFLVSSSVYNGTYHDPSWMANNALWDSWFLSGIVDASTLSASSWAADTRSPRQQFRDLAENTRKLRNQRFLYHQTEPIDTTLEELFDSSNALKPSAINKLPRYLLVDGAFNVNSTSAEAWKALLSSVREQELFVTGGAKQQFVHPLGTLGYAYNNSPTNDWAGLRDLSDTEINALANAIVVEVKARGPFLSMGDFVNRRPNSSIAAHQALGALQAAIDKSGLNARSTQPGRTLSAAEVPILAGRNTLNSEPAPTRALGSAGFLSQAAVLSALGSQIAVRGDTFMIRTYGDARDASNKIIAKAWCEAVVQRVPEYVDPIDRPEASTGWPNSGDTLSTTNTAFGRRMEILSFRWLNPLEI